MRFLDIRKLAESDVVEQIIRESDFFPAAFELTENYESRRIVPSMSSGPGIDKVNVDDRHRWSPVVFKVDATQLGNRRIIDRSLPGAF
jgi:hypothetical protein